MLTILPAAPGSLSGTWIPSWMSEDSVCRSLCFQVSGVFKHLLPQVLTSEHRLKVHSKSQALYRSPSRSSLGRPHGGVPHSWDLCTGEIWVKWTAREALEINKGQRWLQRAWWVCFHRRQPAVQWLLVISSCHYCLLPTRPNLHLYTSSQLIDPHGGRCQSKGLPWEKGPKLASL